MIKESGADLVPMLLDTEAKTRQREADQMWQRTLNPWQPETAHYRHRKPKAKWTGVRRVLNYHWNQPYTEVSRTQVYTKEARKKQEENKKGKKQEGNKRRKFWFTGFLSEWRTVWAWMSESLIKGVSKWVTEIVRIFMQPWQHIDLSLVNDNARKKKQWHHSGIGTQHCLVLPWYQHGGSDSQPRKKHPNDSSLGSKLKTHHTFSNVFKPFFKEMLGKGFCNPRAQSTMAAHWKCQQQQLQLEASMQGHPQPKHSKKSICLKRCPIWLLLFW